MSTYTFSNGQTLVSSALAQGDLNAIVQTLTLGVLGINPATDALAYSKVRIGWIAQPAWAITDDVCSITATEQDADYNRILDRRYAWNDSASVRQNDTYTRVWQVKWVFYGPNGFDHARLLKSSMRLDFTHDTLLASNLTLTGNIPATMRAPELFEGQWWDRSDVKLSFYELVTESLVVNSIASVEIKVYNKTGLVDDLTVSS